MEERKRMSKREGGDGGEKENEQEGGGRWRRESE